MTVLRLDKKKPFGVHSILNVFCRSDQRSSTKPFQVKKSKWNKGAASLASQRGNPRRLPHHYISSCLTTCILLKPLSYAPRYDLASPLHYVFTLRTWQLQFRQFLLYPILFLLSFKFRWLVKQFIVSLMFGGLYSNTKQFNSLLSTMIKHWLCLLQGVMPRVYETVAVLILLMLIVLGLTYVVSALIDKGNSSIQTSTSSTFSSEFILIITLLSLSIQFNLISLHFQQLHRLKIQL